MTIALPKKWVWDSWYVRDGDLWHGFFLQADKSLGDPPRIERAAREAIGDERFEEAFTRGLGMDAASAGAYAGIAAAADTVSWP